MFSYDVRVPGAYPPPNDRGCVPRQDYVGANTLPLLLPVGQFGTRLQGGKDAASARYIFTRVNPVTRMLFPADDDASLNYVEDDGVVVEPQYYVPVLPMALVNGAEGIGTGWSTSLPSFNPLQVQHRDSLPVCTRSSLATCALSSSAIERS